MDPIDEANALLRMIIPREQGGFGYTKKRAGEIVGVSGFQVTRKVALASLIPELQDFVRRKVITEQQGYFIAKQDLKPDFQRLMLDKIRDGVISGDDEVKGAAANYNVRQNQASLFGTDLGGSQQYKETVKKSSKDRAKKQYQAITKGAGKTLKEVFDAETFALIPITLREEGKLETSIETIREMKKALTKIEKELEQAKSFFKSGGSVDQWLVDKGIINPTDLTKSRVKGHYRNINGKMVWIEEHQRKGDAKPKEVQRTRPSQLQDLPASLRKKCERGGPGEGGEITLTKKEVKTLLEKGVVGFVSAGKNPQSQDDIALTAADINKRDKMLKRDLTDAGLKFVRVTGKYGEIEDSYMVMIPDARRDELITLGKKYNQDSIIFSDHNKNEMIYTTGENQGRKYKGDGFETLSSKAEDFYTEVKTTDGKLKFSLKFNWDKLEKGIVRILAKAGNMIKQVLPTKAPDPDDDDDPDAVDTVHLFQHRTRPHLCKIYFNGGYHAGRFVDPGEVIYMGKSRMTALEKAKSKKKIKSSGKSFSARLAEKHPGGRWVTITDESSPLHGRPIFIVPHADGTATIVHAPKHSGLKHKVLSPKKDKSDKTSKDVKEEADKKRKKKELSTEEREKLVEKGEAKKKELESERESKTTEFHDVIREKVNLDLKITEEDKKKITQKVKQLAKKENMSKDEERAELLREHNKLRQKKNQELMAVVNEAKEALNAPPEKAKELNKAVRENAEEFLRYHYEIKEYDKALRKVNKELRKANGPIRAKAFEVKTKDISSKDIESFVADEKAIEAEIANHYDLVIATRGGFDKDGKEIEANNTRILNAMNRGGYESFNAVASAMTNTNIIDRDMWEKIGAQNAAILLNHYFKDKLGKDYKGAMEGLQEYVAKNADKVAGKAVRRGDKYLYQAEKTREFGKGEDALFSNAMQAMGASLRYMNLAYEAYGQAEGSMNQMAELLYVAQQRGDAPIKITAGTRNTLYKRLNELGLNKSDGKIEKTNNGYELTISPSQFGKMTDEKVDLSSADIDYKNFPTAQDIKLGRANEKNWVPVGLKSYFNPDADNPDKEQKLVLGEHQQSAARLVAQQKRVYLNHEAGTGKSLTYLAAKAAIEEETGKPCKTLISMPTKLTANFMEEVKKFSDYDVLDLSGTTHSHEERKKLMKEADPNTIILVNKEKFRGDQDFRGIKEAGFDMIVPDEAHTISQRESRSKQSAMSRGLANIMKDVPYYIAGSGTPTPKDLSELYFHLNIMNPEKFNSQKDFMNKYGHLHKGEGFKEFAAQVLNSEVGDHIHTVKKEIKTNLIKNDHRVELTKEQKKAYKEIQAQYLKDKNAGRKAAGLWRYNKTRKLLNSSDPNINPKFGQMDRIMDDHFKSADKGEKMSVYCETYDEADAIKKFIENKYGKGSTVEFSGRTPDSQLDTLKQNFKTDENVKVSIHTKAGTAGLNLQYTGDSMGTTGMIMFSSSPESYSYVDQYFSRGNRTGAKKDVQAHMLYTDSPFEYASEERLDQEEAVQGLLQQAKEYDTEDVLGQVMERTKKYTKDRMNKSIRLVWS